MSPNTDATPLGSLDYLPYLNDSGCLPEEWQRTIGVYAIFNQNKELQFVGYSRDIYLSLKQHLVRQPDSCYWLKVQTINRPSRSLLEGIRQKWIEENGSIPPGNREGETEWTEPIDAKRSMTDRERQDYQQSDELGRTKLLKKVARRLESEIQDILKNRGVGMDVRFNPKLKEEGLLDLK